MSGKLDVYLAIPYSDPDPAEREARFRTANAFAGKLMAAGLTVFSPISHTHPIASAVDLPLGWDYWERFDRFFIENARLVVVVCLPGVFHSKGVQAEYAIAKEQGKRVVWIDPEQFEEDEPAEIARIRGALMYDVSAG